MWLWIIAFYVFAALCVGFFLFMLNLSRPGFRDQMGDITSEVGYEENQYGDNITAADPGSLGTPKESHTYSSVL